MSQFDPYQPPAYRAAVARRSPLATGWKIAIGCGAATLVAIAAAFALILYLGTRSVPDGIRVEVEAPVSVVAGDNLTVVARVRNDDLVAHSLVDLDVAKSFLAGILLHSSEPPFAESLDVPLIDVQSYTYNLEVPAGGTLELRFSARAVEVGDHAGSFEFCIDSAVVCAPYSVRTIVLPPGAPPPAAVER